MCIRDRDEPVPDPFVAVTETGNVPSDVGVPEIRPAVVTDNPSGRPLAPKLKGFPFAAIWKLKG